MARKVQTPVQKPPTKLPEQAEAGDNKSPEVALLLEKAGQLLQDGQAKKALELLGRSRLNSPWLTNALGVCHLRLGDSGRAVDIFRSLVLAGGGLALRPEVPTVFKTNYATALLLDGNVTGCLSALAETKADGHPAVQKLRKALDDWRASLSLWQKLQWCLGSQPDGPTELAYPPGDL